MNIGVWRCVEICVVCSWRCVEVRSLYVEVWMC